MSRSTPGTIVIAGSLAQRPFIGGHTWVFLQYLLGLRRLGWDVLFVDRLEPGMCVGEGGEPSSFADSANLRYLAEVMERFGLGRPLVSALRRRARGRRAGSRRGDRADGPLGRC